MLFGLLTASGESAGTHSTGRGIERARGTVGRGTARGLACLTYFTCLTALALYCGLSVIGFSATCTAPPASNAPPAAVAESLARADLTDIVLTSCCDRAKAGDFRRLSRSCVSCRLSLPWDSPMVIDRWYPQKVNFSRKCEGCASPVPFRDRFVPWSYRAGNLICRTCRPAVSRAAQGRDGSTRRR